MAALWNFVIFAAILWNTAIIPIRWSLLPPASTADTLWTISWVSDGVYLLDMVLVFNVSRADAPPRRSSDERGEAPVAAGEILGKALEKEQNT